MISHISAQRPAGLQAGGLLRVWEQFQVRQWAKTKVLAHPRAPFERKA